VSPNPFLEPRFVLAAARGLGVTDVGLLVVRNRGDWLAALPVRRVLAWRAVLGRCLASWVHLYCFLGTPLVAESDPEAALTLLLRRGLRDCACIALDLVDADGPLAAPLSAALAAESRTVVLERFERATLRRRPTCDYLEQTISSRHRKELRRTFRKMVREVGDLTVVDRSDDPSAYEQFMQIEATGWKGRRGTGLGCRAGHAAFFREMCGEFAANGKLELLSLQTGDRTLAMKCNLLADGVTFCFKIGYDDGFARFSPGIHLELANIEHFHAGTSSWSDSCAAPSNAMINRLWPGRRALQSLVPCRRGVSGTLPYLRWKTASATLLPARAELAGRVRNRVPRD
jgi:CelD/BcsL family acetyltransferase involved in cellulose biosynthesis